MIPLKEFEDDELLRVKPTRTAGEYCWTCSSSTILYCLNHYHLDCCTYIDADLFFYSDPTVLIKEMGENDVLITEHRYSPQYDQTETAGKYCVQFVTFKNTPNGMKILKWWRDACLDWCYGRYEDGKFGDQKYLDDWTTRFNGVYELKNLGGGVAPWNVQQYTFRRDGKIVNGKENSTNVDFTLIFYHFHFLKSYKSGIFRYFNVSPYPIPSSALQLVYKLYLKELKKCYNDVKSYNCEIDGLATQSSEEYSNVWGWLKKMRRHLIIEKDYRYHYWIAK